MAKTFTFDLVLDSGRYALTVTALGAVEILDIRDACGQRIDLETLANREAAALDEPYTDGRAERAILAEAADAIPAAGEWS